MDENQGCRTAPFIGDHHRQSGDYFRVDYDPHLGRYAHHRPGWENVHEYHDRTPCLDAGWYEAISRSLLTQHRQIHVGRMAIDWPAVRLSVVEPPSTWLRLDAHLDGALAASALMLCGVERASESGQLRSFNNEVGHQPRVTIQDGWLRPYRLRERPLCVSVWFIDKDDAPANITLNFALQASSDAYFRLRWVA